jgi:hypothetical protein
MPFAVPVNIGFITTADTASPTTDSANVIALRIHSGRILTFRDLN